MYRESASSREVDYLGVHTAFAATQYGETLGSCVRYDKYRPPDVSSERWEELLGPDVNNLDHLIDTYQLTCVFIGNTERLQPGLLLPRNKAVLKIGAIIHDWDESINPDINYFEKTEDHEIAERQSFIKNLPNFYTGNDPGVKDLIDEAVEEVIFEPDSHLGSIFNVIERIGYLRTGLRAGQLACEQAAPDCDENLRWLSASVLSSDHLEHLMMKGRRLFAAHHFLVAREAEICESLEMVDPAVFDAHEPTADAIARLQGLQRSRQTWNAWHAGLRSTLR